VRRTSEHRTEAGSIASADLRAAARGQAPNELLFEAMLTLHRFPIA
jgi:hypothetical protein